MLRKLLVLATVFVAIATQKADASLVFTLNEVGADVVLSGSGTVNLTGTAYFLTDIIVGSLKPDSHFAVGATGLADGFFYLDPIVGPSDFGPGLSGAIATSGSGDGFGFGFMTPIIALPIGYAGGPLSGTATFAGATINGLGAATGTYVWNIANGDTITLIVGPSSAVPEPSTLLMLAIGVVGVAFARRRN